MPEPDLRVVGGRSAVPAETLLAFRDVEFSAGQERLVDGMSFRLSRGARTVIMGPNGAGKSLTLRLIQGLIRPDAGTISWSGQKDRPAGQRAAIVFQKPVLLRRSVAANLRHALSVYGVPARQQTELVARYLQMGGLERLADRPARVLSGGEQQRLSIIRALASEPELLLLDEPSASLDPRSTDHIETLMLEANRRGTTLVLVTHDAGQAKRIADEILFVQAGKLAEHSPAEEFFVRPASDAARAYLEGRLLF